MRAIKIGFFLLLLGIIVAPSDIWADEGADAPSATPAGLLDIPLVQGHRAIGLAASGVGVAGSLTLSAFGIYGLVQDLPAGLGRPAAQDDALFIAGGLVLSSLFSFCLNALSTVQ
jgi:hypothetical protein